MGDEEFDRVFPERVRSLSPCHWTPVEAGRQAAQWLVTEPGTRVLDVGCGPGKFCAIGAATTLGHFTGVEQRGHLCRAGRSMLGKYGIPRVDIIQANVTDVAFQEFDAFYIFNPFEENVFESLRIDEGVDLNATFYFQYTSYVRGELSRLPEGTRVVTFWGDCEEIPSCYDCEETACGGRLRLWIKRRAGKLQGGEDTVAVEIHRNRLAQCVPGVLVVA
ncbi:MAG TPA: class I SAM-dependent methyltransferase [Candidatus Saccharimonadia bacterium]|nr:class I SAM-dependent methyltransferase [Candidatus Saccharimonadia bacterium]